MTEPKPGLEPLFSPKQAAQYLMVHPKTVYNLIWKGKLTPVKIGRTVRIQKSELARILEESKKKLGKPKE